MCLSITWRGESWGSLSGWYNLEWLRPVERSSWRCSLPSYSDFSHHIWTASWEDARTSFLSSSSCWFLFWSCWTKIAHLNMPEKHSHTRLSIISLGILPVLQPQVECTCGGARRISRSSARGAPRPATMEAVIKCKVQSIILCWFAKEPAVSLTAKLRLDEVCRLFGFINRNHVRQYKSTGLSTIQSVIQLYGCTVWWLSLVWTIYTPFVCKKGIFWWGNDTWIMGMGWD